MKIEFVKGNTVYLVGDEPLSSSEEILSKMFFDGRVFVKKTNVEGVYTYGSEQTTEEWMGHRKGYIWSSRASVINKAFDLCLIEACYRSNEQSIYKCCAIDLVQYEDALREAGYEVNWPPVENTEMDVHYSLKKIKEQGGEF